METKTPTTPDSLTKLSAEAIAFYVLTDVYPDNILDMVKMPITCKNQIKKHLDLDEDIISTAADILIHHSHKQNHQFEIIL